MMKVSMVKMTFDECELAAGQHENQHLRVKARIDGPKNNLTIREKCLVDFDIPILGGQSYHVTK